MQLKALRSLCTLRQQLQLRDVGITSIIELAAFSEQELRDANIKEPGTLLDYARAVVLGDGPSDVAEPAMQGLCKA